jgi:ComF family protein
VGCNTGEEDITLKRLSSLLFGGSCFLCRGAAQGVLCPACDADLPRLAPAGEMRLCPRCALASPGGALCGRCLAGPPAYDATVAGLAYAFPADTLVHALKFRGELALAPLLAAILSQRLPSERVDLVVPVPLSPGRLRSRGYNQSAEIARHLGSRAPLELFLCERSRDTAAQTDLPWSERRRNVRGAFRCARPIRGGTVAVVDDVMTTGATLDEIASVLKQAGAARVVNWVVARTYVET